ncbi:hypothetical protein E2C01_098431 [Portunus trituberculatus]|uniref:Uncharacterized protein n=1 Tax=Portunus trituberculatus TaxID=210409 RepID=A0A5B7K7M6_PORTR|nr:hypothetical protein [Portunus trituberculatus]
MPPSVSPQPAARRDAPQSRRSTSLQIAFFVKWRDIFLVADWRAWRRQGVRRAANTESCRDNYGPRGAARDTGHLQQQQQQRLPGLLLGEGGSSGRKRRKRSKEKKEDTVVQQEEE